MNNTPCPTISEAAQLFYDMKVRSRTKATAGTYNQGIQRFCRSLKDNGVDPDKTPITDLDEDYINWLIEDCQDLAPATESLYLTAAIELYEYSEAERWRPMNLSRLRYFIHARGRRQTRNIPDYPKDELEQLIEYADKLKMISTDDIMDHLRNLRDRALIITLADTGLRISEACNLDRGTLNKTSRQAYIVGKGGRDAIIRFSDRAMEAIDDYLKERTRLLDGKTGKPLSSLPIFARHDKAAGRKNVKRITSRTGQNILDKHVSDALGEDFNKEITPHTLRHRFVTKVLDKTGNMELARKLARHANIGVTQRYVHITDKELDKGYGDIFD